MTLCLEPGREAGFRRALAEAGFEAVRAGDVSSALGQLRQTPCAVMLADAILPGCDGEALARRVAEAGSDVHPFVLLATPPGLRLVGVERLGDWGAATLPAPPTAEAILRACARLRDEAALPPGKAMRLDHLLDRLGVPAHVGRDILRRAVALVWRDGRRMNNLKDGVYPDAARPFDRSAAQAERAIRHVIEAAWRTGEIDEQHRIFGDTIDARRGRPTCGEMIAQLADILKWEG